MTFGSMASLASAARSAQHLLDTLLLYGVLVRGCWLAKSELACEGSARQALARDYLLCTLHCHDWLPNRREFTDFVRLPAEIVRELFNRLAVHVKDKGWKLRLEQDTSFLKSHPAIAERFDKMWSDRAKTIKDEIVNAKPDAKPVADARGASFKKQPPPASGSGSSAGALQQRTGGVASNGDKGAASAKAPTVATTAVRQGADPYEGTAQEQLSSFVSAQLKRHMVVSLPFLRRALAQRTAEANPRNLLAGELSDEQLRDALAVFAGSMHDTFYLRSVGVPSIDKYRDVVLDVFREKQTITKADVKASAMRVLNEDVPAALFTKFMKELARPLPNGNFALKKADVL
eukprot:TRINITY_DN4086_c1_g1_i1.p1 TRINITY_DN4086_c1_g1~~TRINITY_DN4086_c1_g1_i1.p1  ORF type:complete len:346 (+),score=87.04 TRINITY_DN4086_c1_g1_i1:159-1196(+)